MQFRSRIAAAVLFVAFSGSTINGINPAAAQDSSAAFMDAQHKMMSKMKTMKPTGDPDKDFVMMMMPHHQGAVDMAEVELKYGKDPMLRKMAEQIIKSQKEEIAEMEKWQKEHGM
ncbi:DUF305 domain-containing protein [Dongia sp.]|uniref:CopM family metallochaperone n=1 Tax=Dongia sp. TaxID=1977262 RepID=UPI0037516F2E